MDSPSQSVLVVDDDPSIRLLCRVNLELDGWHVIEAATVEQARRALVDAEVAVVLLDVHVGTADGLELLAEIRRDRPGLRVALLTGSAGPISDDQARADEIVTKPFTLEKLNETVRRLALTTVEKAG
ncbi:MAG TPA: response regulator [Gaiellaceae bacterium]